MLAAFYGKESKKIFNLTHVREILISTFSQRQFSVPLIIGLLLAYAGEMGQPTFHTDSYFEIWYRDNFLDYWTGYGRYLSKLIMLALDRVYPPTFLLLIAVMTLACVGVLLAALWSVSGKARPILVIILCTFPFFFETFSYAPGRYVPLAIGFGVLSVITDGMVGLICALGAVFIYQSSLYFALVVALVWAAIDVLRGCAWSECVRRIVIPKVGLIVIATGIDNIVLRLVDAFLSPIALVHYRLISSLYELRYALAAHGRAMLSFFLERGVFLFPYWTKLVAVFGILTIVTAVVRSSLTFGNRLFVLVVLAALPFAAHGATLCLADPNPFLFERVLLGYAAVYAGIFAIALACPLSHRVRSTVIFLFATAAAGFVYQANVWHEYLRLKNMADMDMARAISDRLKADPQYHSGGPLVVVGSVTPADYLPYRAFHPKEGVIQNTNINSAYALQWSSDRFLMFFVSFRWPTAEEIATAKRNAMGRGPWPASDSVFIRDGVMTIVLSRPSTRP